MDTWDAVTSRRQVRSFTDDPVPEDALHRILEAGRRAPSGMNRQPWDFVVIRDEEQRQRLAGVWQGAGWIAGAPTVIALVVPIEDDDGARLMHRFDAGQVAMQMTITATALGVASGQAACANQTLAGDVLGFPEGRHCILLIAFGFPADRPLQPIVNPSRREFAEVVHFDRW